MLRKIVTTSKVAWSFLTINQFYKGPVKALLEHPLWFPLGRLSYCAFLAHWFMIHLLLDGGDRLAHFVSLWHTYLTVTIPVVFLSYIIACAS
ncbi:hypothetical protein PRIPAC_97839 [Pristionchus pacificus]|uniref:Uncharacterized protein n=1 Tax=Pristionchus pacificus TaxID=54126 RepID=A0A2A6BIW9_PRIPA|nr:hypothetical protein PRIPAC_97839 [Pristionchus pacificus]|eukprot:PDM65837.1 hypothetical protein PRIPAC_45238 [Pristionchus pacificus]